MQVCVFVGHFPDMDLSVPGVLYSILVARKLAGIVQLGF